ncbi:MAG: hypothetical protein AB2417_01475 [Clostridiaceae bacterium]|nr:hypothetical protein [Clostridium mobile]
MEYKEIKVVNRGKIAYLHTYGVFEERIDKIIRNEQEMYAFVYLVTNTVRDLLKRYDEDDFLKKYNSSFKQIAYAIKKERSREIN